MFTGAVHKKDECEEHTTRLMGAWLEKLTDRMVSHIKAYIEARGHKPLDPGPQYEPDFEERLRRLEGAEPIVKTVYYGNNHEPPSHKHPRSQVPEILVRIGIGLLTAAVGFAYGRLWDHEHRISVIEGREVSHVGSP